MAVLAPINTDRPPPQIKLEIHYDAGLLVKMRVPLVPRPSDPLFSAFELTREAQGADCPGGRIWKVSIRRTRFFGIIGRHKTSQHA